MKKIVYFIGIIFLLIFIYLVYSGMFSSATLHGHQELGPFKVAYAEQKGNYAKTRMAIQKVYATLTQEKIPTLKAYGIFYNNPSKVKQEDLRSEGGFIIDTISKEQIASISKLLRYKIIPKSRYVVAEFPIRTKLSSFLGPAKAYPLIKEYLEKNGQSIDVTMEIFDSQNKKLIYCLSVKNK